MTFAVTTKKNSCGTLAEFLGYELDTITTEARLPEDKLRRAQELLREF